MPVSVRDGRSGRFVQSYSFASVASTAQRALKVYYRNYGTAMTRAELLDLFRRSGALLEGIFVCPPACTAPGICSARSCCSTQRTPKRSAARWRSASRALRPTVVLSPALGGLIIGHEVGRALGVRAIFAERQDGVLMLRRGFMLAEIDRVLVVEDVLTTGGSTRETIQVATAAGGLVVGAARHRRPQRRRRALRRSVRGASRGRPADLRGRRVSAVRSGDAGGQARVATRVRDSSAGLLVLPFRPSCPLPFLPSKVMSACRRSS